MNERRFCALLCSLSASLSLSRLVSTTTPNAPQTRRIKQRQRRASNKSQTMCFVLDDARCECNLLVVCVLSATASGTRPHSIMLHIALFVTSCACARNDEARWWQSLSAVTVCAKCCNIRNVFRRTAAARARTAHKHRQLCADRTTTTEIVDKVRSSFSECVVQETCCARELASSRIWRGVVSQHITSDAHMHTKR